MNRMLQLLTLIVVPYLPSPRLRGLTSQRHSLSRLSITTGWRPVGPLSGWRCTRRITIRFSRN